MAVYCTRKLLTPDRPDEVFGVQQFRIGVGNFPAPRQKPAAAVPLIAGQLISVQLQFGVLTHGREGALRLYAVAIAARHIKIGVRPLTVITRRVPDDLGAPTAADGANRVGKRGQCRAGRPGQASRRDRLHAGGYLDQLKAGCRHLNASLLRRLANAIVDDFDDGHRAIANAVHRLNRILAQQQPAVAVAVVKLVARRADETAPAILFNGAGTGRDEGLQVVMAFVVVLSA